MLCIPHFGSEAIIDTRALCLYLLIVAAWRRAVLRALAEAALSSLVSTQRSTTPRSACADITGHKFCYNKLQMSDVCDARTDILDASSWDNDSYMIWEQAFLSDTDCMISLTEYDRTTKRQSGTGHCIAGLDAPGSSMILTSSNQTLILFSKDGFVRALSVAATASDERLSEILLDKSLVRLL